MQVMSTSDIVGNSDYVTYIKELFNDAIKLVNTRDFSGLLNRLEQCFMKYPATGTFFPRLRTAQVICLERLGRLKETLELARINLNGSAYNPVVAR